MVKFRNMFSELPRKSILPPLFKSRKIKVTNEIRFSIGTRILLTLLLIRISISNIVVTLLLVVLLHVSPCLFRLNVVYSAFLRTFGPITGHVRIWGPAVPVTLSVLNMTVQRH